MRGSLVFVAMFGSLVAGAATIDSRIDAVALYSQGATVSRVAEVSLRAGDNRVEFTGLSATISEQRFQVEVDGEDVVLGQVRFDKVQRREAFDAAVRALQDEIYGVEARIAALADSSKAANLQLKFLDGIAQGYAKESWFEGARGNADISSWRSALAVLDEGSAAAHATLRDNAKASRGAQQELSKLKREMQDLRGQGLAAMNVAMTLGSKTAQQATVKLHYFQAQARWSPQYTSYLDSETRQLRLLQKALVEQTTDEDWADALLTLSTSEPSDELVPPELDSEFLDLRQPEAPAFDRAPLARMKSAAPGAVAEVAVVAPPPPRVGNYGVTYAVPGRVDVANDADEAQVFELAGFNFATELVTRIVPRQSMTAFLTARFIYDQDLPLYGNSMLVYVDQVFVGETWLPTALPGDEVVLPVGQDRRVEFTVRNQGGAKGEGGFIGRRKRELTSNLFEIVNRRGSPTTVEVFDRYPTAVNKDIEVTVPRQATPPTERDYQDKPGVILWRKSLGGGETWRIAHQYEVSYPADKTVVSNPR